MAITLTRPAAGQTVNVAASKEQLEIVLSFPLADAILERDGDNLAMSFDGGEKIVIENFYTEYTGKEIPDFVVEDATITGEEFFKSLGDETLMPAAGPESQDGGRFYDYDPAALARGIDALGKVAGGSDYGRFGELDPGEVAGRPAAPALIIVWDKPLNDNPTLPEGVNAPSLGLPGGWVSESGLQNGSLPNNNAHPTVTTGTITITSPGGLSGVLINGAPLGTAPVASGPGNFTFGTPVNNGDGTYTLTFTYTLTGDTEHPDGQDQNWLDGDLPSFTVAVIDNYGQTSPTATTTVQILDDIPNVNIGVIAEAGVTLTTQDAGTIGDASSTASASFQAAILNAVNANYGADGAGSTTVSNFALTVNNSASGLTSGGAAIVLSTDGNDVVGKAGDTVVFRISASADGNVTMTQYEAIDHAAPGATSNYADQLATLAAGKISLGATVTVTDSDGDTATSDATIDLGGNLNFADDGPSVTVVATTGAAAATGDSQLGTTFTTETPVVTVTPTVGADSNNSSVATLVITNAVSGLKTTAGQEITLVNDDSNTVVGKYDSNGDGTLDSTAFTVKLNEGNTLSVTQSVALYHDDPNSTTETVNLAGKLGVKVTVTDGDGDTASSTVDIGSNITFSDAGPTANADIAGVGEGGSVSGNVLVGSNNSGDVADKSGEDGWATTGGVVGVTATDWTAAATPTDGYAFTLTSTYGALDMKADGSYTFTSKLDSVDNTTPPLVFTYTVKDGDGDTDTATLTINVANRDAIRLTEASFLAGTVEPQKLFDLPAGVTATREQLDAALDGTPLAGWGKLDIVDGALVLTLTNPTVGHADMPSGLAPGQEWTLDLSKYTGVDNREFTIDLGNGNKFIINGVTVAGNNLNVDQVSMTNYTGNAVAVTNDINTAGDTASGANIQPTNRGYTFTPVGTDKVLDLGEGNDVATVTGTISAGKIAGGTGNDTFWVKDMTGGTVEGNADNDTFLLYGKMSDGVLDGGVGNDQFAVREIDGTSKIDGGAGYDRMSISWDQAQATTLVAFDTKADGLDDTITTGAQIQRVEVLDLGSGNDTITIGTMGYAGLGTEITKYGYEYEKVYEYAYEEVENEETGAMEHVIKYDTDRNPEFAKDANGNLVVKLDAEGNTVFKLDADGNRIIQLDANGNPVIKVTGDPQNIDNAAILTGGTGNDTITIDTLKGGLVDGFTGEDKIHIKDMQGGVVDGGGDEDIITIDKMSGGFVHVGGDSAKDTVILTGAASAYTGGRIHGEGMDTLYVQDALLKTSITRFDLNSDKSFEDVLNGANSTGVNSLNITGFGTLKVDSADYTAPINITTMIAGTLEFAGGTSGTTGVTVNITTMGELESNSDGERFTALKLGSGNDVVTIGTMNGGTIYAGAGDKITITTLNGGKIVGGEVILTNHAVLTCHDGAYYIGDTEISDVSKITMAAGKTLFVAGDIMPAAGTEYATVNGMAIPSVYKDVEKSFTATTLTSLTFESSGIVTVNGIAHAVPELILPANSAITLKQADADIKTTDDGKIVYNGITISNVATINGHSGNDVMNIDATAAALSAKVNGGTGIDTINIKGGISGSTVSGGDEKDTITIASVSGDAATVLNSTVKGDAGDDKITITALPGVAGAMQNSTVEGGMGVDNINITGRISGSSTVDGGDGNDVINITNIAGASAATLLSSTVKGGIGNDTINITAKSDADGGQALQSVSKVEGGTGNDTITILGKVSSGSEVNGGDGGDTITITNIAGGNTATVHSSTVTGGAGDDTINISGLYGLDTGRAIAATSTVSGGDGKDTINITGRITDASIVRGDAGDDTINISGIFGQDNGRALNKGYVYGDADNDTINITGRMTGGSIVDGGAGNDVISITKMYGIENFDVAVGGSTVLGGTGDDKITIDGDIVDGGKIDGGAGNDVISVNAVLTSTDTFNGTIDGDGTGAVAGNTDVDVFIYNHIANTTTNEGHIITLNGGGTVNIDGIDYANIMNFEGIGGGAGNDTLTGNSLDNILIGGGGNDILLGGAGDDTFVFGVHAGTIDIVKDFGFDNDADKLDLSAFKALGYTIAIGTNPEGFEGTVLNVTNGEAVVQTIQLEGYTGKFGSGDNAQDNLNYAMSSSSTDGGYIKA